MTTKAKTFTQKLAEIQQTMVAQKDQRNDFGKYNYRSAEGIMQAVKPHLGDMIVTITDDLRELAGRVYVEAIVTISDGKDEKTTHAFAREPDMRKGQDVAQTTGSSSSYARKYALSGLFLIDNNPDPDSTSKHDETHDDTQPRPVDENLNAINSATTHDALAQLYRALDEPTRNSLVSAFKARQATLTEQQA